MQTATATTVLVIGSLGWECAIRLPLSLAPGAFIQSQSFHQRPGGTGSNLAAGLSSAGLSTRLVGSVGNDQLGNQLRDRLVLAKVQCDFQVLPNETSRSIILIEPTGERTIIGLTSDLLDLTDVSTLDLTNVSMVVFPSWRPRFRAALDIAREQGCFTVVGLRALADPSLPSADLAIGSRHELSGITDPSLHLSRFDIIVVTEGVKGSFIYQQHHNFAGPVLPADPVDSTGAGDAFMAGFIAEWVRGERAERCALVGAAWGAAAVECEGALPPRWEEVTRRLARYGEEYATGTEACRRGESHFDQY